MIRPRTPFDPLHILTEICAFQFVLYAGQIFILLFLDFLSDIPFTLSQVFNPYVFCTTTKLGRICIISQIIGSLGTGFVYAAVEQRARKALDFMSTLYTIHLILVIVFVGFPTKIMWWIISFFGWAASTVCAEVVSTRFEVQDIRIDNILVNDN